MCESGVHVAVPCRDNRVDMLGDERPDAGLERLDPAGGEVGSEQPPEVHVPRPVRRERDELGRPGALDERLAALEGRRVPRGGLDLRVARERPETAVGRGVGDGTALTQLCVEREELFAARRLERGPVLAHVGLRRVHGASTVGTLNVPHSGHPVIVTSPSSWIAEVRARSSSSVTSSISVARGAPAQRCGPAPKAR